MKVSTVEQMRQMDQRAIKEFGIPDYLLMENAGGAASSVILQLHQASGSISGKKVMITCGIGNNGGDGLVVARRLHSHGALVHLALLGDPAKYSGASGLNWDIVKKLGIEYSIVEEGEEKSMVEFGERICGADTVVDAILGTGLTREVQGLYKKAIECINSSGKTVIALDIPSGVNGNTGQVLGVAVRAQYCITFGLPKAGNVLYPGYALGGKHFVSFISFPPSFRNSEDLRIVLSNHLSLPPLPPRDPNGHKTSFGQALFVVGASSYYGAPFLSSFSFLKAGGGYSRMAAPASIVPVIAGKAPEIVFHPQPEEQGALSIGSKDQLLEISKRMSIVVIGPGMSLTEGTHQLVKALVQEIDKPILIDGDGLTIVASALEVLKSRKHPTILTPHPGEMAKLSKLSIKEVEADRIGTLSKTCKETNCIIVLKGGHSLIGYPDGRVLVNMSGNSAMGTAGVGDVLCGTIAACYGIGLSPEDAAAKGVFLHGLAGDIAAREQGEGITAEDVMKALPYAFKMDRAGLDPILKDQYEGFHVLD